MTTIENCMQQRSEEWLKMRRSFLGASDAPVILGISPYMTPYELWLEKLGLGQEREVSPAMQRGIDLEDKALDWINSNSGYKFKPSVRFHRTIPYMMASLDGEDGETILEVKCNGRKIHDDFVRSGIVPEHHYAQIQHQLLVCDVNKCLYMSFDGEAGTLFEVKRDDAFAVELLEKEAKFWDCVANLIAPEMTEKDRNRIQKDKCVDMSHNSDWKRFSEEYKECLELIQDYQEIADYAKKRMIELANEKNCYGCGVRLSKIEKKGSIDYNSIPEIKDLDLEKYRKSSTTYWKVESE